MDRIGGRTPRLALTRIAGRRGLIQSVSADFVAGPGKLNFPAATGISPHIAGELFKMMTGINMQHVPYRGAGPAITDLLGGQMQVMFDNVSSSLEHIRAGK